MNCPCSNTSACRGPSGLDMGGREPPCTFPRLPSFPVVPPHRLAAGPSPVSADRPGRDATRAALLDFKGDANLLRGLPSCVTSCLCLFYIQRLTSPPCAAQPCRPGWRQCPEVAGVSVLPLTVTALSQQLH